MSNNSEVILVHGLWFRSWVMWRLARRLRKDGFEVRGFNYRTTGEDLDGHARRLREFAHCGTKPEQHFVGHSLGGLVILKMLGVRDDLPPGRVVYLGSPLRGSKVARKAAKIPGATALLGKIKAALGQGYSALPPGRDIGMIAGTKSTGLGWVVGGTEGPGDGTVAIEETRASGLKEHVLLPVSHTSMLFSGNVAEKTSNFLKTGSFGLPAA